MDETAQENRRLNVEIIEPSYLEYIFPWTELLGHFFIGTVMSSFVTCEDSVPPLIMDIVVLVGTCFYSLNAKGISNLGSLIKAHGYSHDTGKSQERIERVCWR